MSDKDADDYIRDILEAKEGRIDIRPLVSGIVAGFGGLKEMGDEAVKLYQRVKGEQAQARLMSDYIKLVLACSESKTGDDDELPEDIEQLRALAEEVLRGKS